MLTGLLTANAQTPVSKETAKMSVKNIDQRKIYTNLFESVDGKHSIIVRNARVVVEFSLAGQFLREPHSKRILNDHTEILSEKGQFRMV